MAIGGGAIALHVLVCAGLVMWGGRIAKRVPGFAPIAWSPIVPLVMPLFGIAATVFGLVRAFDAVGHADPASRSSVLARGISEAMNSTAFAIATAWALYLVLAIGFAITSVMTRARSTPSPSPSRGAGGEPPHPPLPPSGRGPG
jgi:hypothetical protein